MQSLSEIRGLLDERGLRPRKRFGQNFLHDKNQLRKLVAAASLAPGDVVLEVGPGTGTLTEALLEQGAEVVACEIDRDLADLLRDRLGDRITLIEGDVLERGRRLSAKVVGALGARPFRLVANLPYQVASPLLAALLLEHRACIGQVVTIQAEVADRLLAAPRTKAYGPLGIIVQAFAAVERVGTVPPTCFWPAPQVTSAMVAIRPTFPDRPDDPAAFARFVTGLFSRRRKQLRSTFGDVDWPAGVEPAMRPEALTIEQLVALFEIVRGASPR
jgi:16S rRNA (adenine1518-N6/adenine1519-N6)-dimethyltransferase